MPKPAPPPRVAVLGAGPVGLEAALLARNHRLSVAVFDRGQVCDHVQRWGFVRMFTPFGMNTSDAGRAALRHDAPGRQLPADADLLTGREFREAYLVPLAESGALRGCVHTQTAVVAVGRGGAGGKTGSPFRLLVRGPDAKERVETADVILDCSGTYARPNWVGDAGIPAVGEGAARPHVAYWLDDVLGAKRGHYAGKSVAVVGGGLSAATAVCDLASLAETEQAMWVVWLTRGSRSQPLARVPTDPFRERDKLAARANALATRGDGHVTHHPQVVLDEVTFLGADAGFRLAGRAAGKPATWDVDRVVAHVGYRPDVGFVSELRAGEPGYFTLGAKARARGADFLLADGYAEARRVVGELVG